MPITVPVAISQNQCHCPDKRGQHMAVFVKQVTGGGSASLRREQYQLRSWWCGVRQKGLADIRGDLLQSRFPAHTEGRRYLG